MTERIPDEGPGVQFTQQNHAAIVAVVNTVHQLGIPTLFPLLPELLAVRYTPFYDDTT